MIIAPVIEKLSAEQRMFVQHVINTFGSGDHPAASEKTVGFFESGYLRQLLTPDATRWMTAAGRAHADAILKVLDDEEAVALALFEKYVNERLGLPGGQETLIAEIESGKGEWWPTPVDPEELLDTLRRGPVLKLTLKPMPDGSVFMMAMRKALG